MKRLKLLKLSLRSLNAFGVQGLFLGFRVNLGFRVLGHTAAEHSEEILWTPSAATQAFATSMGIV